MSIWGLADVSGRSNYGSWEPGRLRDQRRLARTEKGTCWRSQLESLSLSLRAVDKDRTQLWIWMLGHFGAASLS